MLKRFAFVVTGVSPILMNNPAKMKPPEGKATAKVPKIPAPEEEARSLLYRDDEGRIFGPAFGFKSAIVSASKGRKFGKQGAPGVIKSNVFLPLETERVYLFDPKTKKPLSDKDYTIDTRRTVLNKTKGVVRSRPRFERWGCQVELDIETDVLDADVVLEFFKIAGPSVGYLDFRPERGGPFGRFSVELKK